ncbi:MAG: hypothetical protein OEP45_00910 [Acidobacteriota bacterium]|nr:hypothetical protein [Acidobacteriota bacterium]
MSRFIALGIAGLLSAGPVVAGERVLEGRATLSPDQEVRIDFPVGELTIEGVSGAELSIEVTGRCKRHTESCDEHLDEVELEVRERRGSVVVEVAPYSKWRWWDSLELEAWRRHPADRPLAVDMGVGELTVKGTQGDLELDLGVGEASVELAARFVRSVHVDAGIGDTELLVPDGWVDGERSFLIGSEASWRDGTGAARIYVDVGVGEAVVRLDD